MKRWAIFAVVMASTALALAGCGATEPEGTSREPTSAANTSPADPSREDLSEADGRLAFMRDPSGGEDEKAFRTYTVNLDGSDVQRLFTEGPSQGARWSPDGTEVSIFCCRDGMAAHILDPDTGNLRTLPQPDPKLDTSCGGSWSPDGTRLTCAAFGKEDPSLNGIYAVRSSDGGGLTRITSNPGGFDAAGDYSPDGERIVFIRFKKERPVGFFVTNVDGSGLQQLTPNDMILDDSGFAGAWSPTGDQMLIVARPSEDAHKVIWMVNADGSGLHQFPITPECGGLLSDPKSVGCYWPSWSPDGTKIVFTRSSADSGENIYIVNADGTGLFQVTDGGVDDQADWGPPQS